MAIRHHIICHPLVRLAISRFVDSFKKGSTRCVGGVLQNVNSIKARSDTDKCLKLHGDPPKVFVQFDDLDTVPPKIKLTVSTGGDKQGNN